MKFDSSLVGFATRSLSKKGTLKIQKAKLNLNNTGHKNEILNNVQAKNNLINVPKKYQYRGKRLNNDSQSIVSSGKSQITTESFKNHQVFHTKSGPIQSNEILYAKSNDTDTFKHSRKLKLMDYRLKGVASPSDNLVGAPESESHTHQDFSSVAQKSTSRVISSKQRSSRGSMKQSKQKRLKAKEEVKDTDVVDTVKLINKRLELLKLDEDDEAKQLLKEREKKKMEAKKLIMLSDSIPQSKSAKSGEAQKEESKSSKLKDIKNIVISIDSKVHGSLLKGKLISFIV